MTLGCPTWVYVVQHKVRKNRAIHLGRFYLGIRIVGVLGWVIGSEFAYCFDPSIELTAYWRTPDGRYHDEYWNSGP